MNSVIQQIELNIAEAKAFIHKADQLDQLFENRLFKDVIMEGFFKDEAVRLVHLKGDPNMQQEERQKAILRDIDGIGVLKGYFSTIYAQAEMAKNAIENDEAELEELHLEGVEE